MSECVKMVYDTQKISKISCLQGPPPVEAVSMLRFRDRGGLKILTPPVIRLMVFQDAADESLGKGLTSKDYW
jgi:hypothetical protein